MGPRNGLRIPGWVFASISTVGAIVTATVMLLRDRAAIKDELHQVRQRQCAVISWIAENDPRFRSPIFREGCP